MGYKEDLKEWLNHSQEEDLKEVIDYIENMTKYKLYKIQQEREKSQHLDPVEFFNTND